MSYQRTEAKGLPLRDGETNSQTLVVEGVCFDLFDTLVGPLPRLETSTALRKLGIRPSNPAYKHAKAGFDLVTIAQASGLGWDTARDLFITRQFDSIDGIAQAIFDLNGRRISPSSCRIAHELVKLRHERSRLEKGALHLLKQLRRANIKTAIVTNIHSALLPVMDKLGLSELIDVIVPSCNIGAKKPSALPFTTAAQRMNVDHGRLLMFGNSWCSDVIGALAAGLGVIWIDDGSDPLAAAIYGGDGAPLLALLQSERSLCNTKYIAPWIPKDQHGAILPKELLASTLLRVTRVKDFAQGARVLEKRLLSGRG